MRIIFSLLFALYLAPSVWATTYYTAKDCTGGTSPPNCNNANNGLTRQTAELTIAAGIAHLASGDTLVIGDGVYDEVIDDLIPSGSIGAPTIVQAENRNGAIVRPTTNTFAFGFGNRSYITVDGIDADEISVGGGSPYVFKFATVPDHLVIKNGKAQNGKGVGGNGLELGTGDGHQILNMDINDNGAASNTAHGIYGAGTNAIYDGNRITNSGGYGFQIVNNSGSANDSTARNNIISGSKERGCFFLGGETNSRVYNNVCYGNNVNDTALAGGADIDGATSALVYNNTFYNNNGNKCIWQISGTSNEYKNNICYSNDADTIVVDAGSQTQVGNLLATDPLFTNAGGADFTLTASSPAIGVGADLSATFSTDIEGNARTVPWDVGAYDFNGSAAVTCSYAQCDNFNTYASSANLDTLAGGIGWSGPWQLISGGNIIVSSAPSGGDGGNAAQSSSATTNTRYCRTFTAVSAGSLRVLVRMSITNPDVFSSITISSNTSTDQIYAGFYMTGNLIAVNGAGLDNIVTTYAANQWYTLTFEWDDAAHPDQYRVQVDSGAFSGYKTTSAAFSTLGYFCIADDTTNAHDLWTDAIGGSTAGTSIIPILANQQMRRRH